MDVNIKEHRCLTMKGGPYELNDDARKIIYFSSSGELYISASHEKSYWVLAFIDKLRRNRVKFTVELVSIEEITQLYSQNVGFSGEETQSSGRQEEVISIIRNAVGIKASDIHIIVRENVTNIKYRVDGELRRYQELSESDGNDICATIYQTMCDVAEPVFNPRRSQDARLMSSSLEKCGLYGGRIATRPTDSGLLMVIRLLYDRGSNNLELEHLGYTGEQVALINRMTARRFGINILSGPTGSGKSTTLECVLKRIIAQREGKAHVLTLEDPPEYRISGAVQTPIQCDKNDDDAISREWARAISNAMRLDPDILMCGEVRDLHSAVATFRAAMTGHGVWTTVHANDALAILTRLQDIGVSPAILTDASLLTGLISQVLARKLCPHCRKPWHRYAQHVAPDIRQRVEKYCQIANVFLRGDGCKACGFSGISGRTVVAEVVEPDNTLMEIYISQGKSAARRYWVEQMGGLTRNHILIQMINQGLIDPCEGERDVCMLDDDEGAGLCPRPQ
ncbi:GspE/PulE family protein [Erwinia sp. HR93]|uniref:GspE/PulE family protein n=1 Tax=Erwinia sp. HR93 TaxID=3094840 RepID=UPI002ADEE3C0|nr:ATPase, T2SS/T4P/T4SS family [Erwinia sp. HR93]MEA1063811.1 ATPase, T2SS/T4P/T4SS family [Erwinia sp. HR93]